MFEIVDKRDNTLVAIVPSDDMLYAMKVRTLLADEMRIWQGHLRIDHKENEIASCI